MLTLSDVQAAQERLRGVAKQTPLIYSDVLSQEAGHAVYLKCENLQRGGAFKLRGAYNKVSALSAEDRRRGVIAHSSGNHAIAVAYACKLLGVSATIVIPTNAVETKVQQTQSYGATVVRCGPTSKDREDTARTLQERHGCVMVHPFNDLLVMAGQGTAGLEIMDALPDLQAVLAPISGGGLLSGVAVAVKSRNPAVKVFGVEPQGADDAYRSLRAGHVVAAEHVDTICDGLRVQRLGELTFEVIRRYVDDIVLVSDEEALDTVRLLAQKEKLIVEPSGAVPAAALRLRRCGAINGPAVALLSGGNIEPSLLRSLIS
jgi:threonine dehydratase